MDGKHIFVTQYDLARLQQLIDSSKGSRHRDKPQLDSLQIELERAVVVDSKVIPHDVVTMNSRVRVRDLDTQTEFICQVVFPRDADLKKNRISVLAPIGTALLGYRAGSTIEWKVPSRVRHLYIIEVEYQPEAANLAA
jgi:regulator of nucleoside diphosphate kinase